MKHTKSREKILNLLNAKSYPISANEIFKMLKKDTITLSTIYRTLSTFEKNNIIEKMENAEGTALFSIKNDKEHMHYLECNKCHKRIEIKYCPFDDIKQKINKYNGFSLEVDDKVLYGICKDCKSINK